MVLRLLFFWSLALRSIDSADVKFISFSDEACESVQYEATFASDQCFRMDDVAVKFSCTIDGTMTTQYWDAGFRDCVGPPTRKLVGQPQCERSTVFGGQSRAFACLNTATTDVVRMSFHADAACVGHSPFDAPFASGSCYTSREKLLLNETNYRPTCGADGRVIIETYQDDSCGGLHAREELFESGTCLGPYGQDLLGERTKYVKFACETLVLDADRPLEKRSVFLVLCVLVFVLATGAALGVYFTGWFDTVNLGTWGGRHKKAVVTRVEMAAIAVQPPGTYAELGQASAPTATAIAIAPDKAFAPDIVDA